MRLCSTTPDDRQFGLNPPQRHGIECEYIQPQRVDQQYSRGRVGS